MKKLRYTTNNEKENTYMARLTSDRIMVHMHTVRIDRDGQFTGKNYRTEDIIDLRRLNAQHWIILGHAEDVATVVPSNTDGI